MSRRKSGLLLAGAALLLGMTACSSASDGASTGFAGGPMKAEAPAAAAPKEAGGAADAQKQQGAARVENAQVQERKLVQTARMELTAPDTFEAISRARSVATETGGFTGQEESSGGKASITLRIPADRFDAALERLGKLGTVTAQNKQADDVTDQVVDLDARLATQRASVDRMRALLARAASVAEIAQIEGELTRRESDLESLQGRRDALGGKVALSTVTLMVSRQAPPPGPPVEEAGTGFLSGLDGGWGAFGTVVSGLATALGAMLPFLVAVGIPVGMVLYFRRKRRKPITATAPTPEGA